MCCGQKRTQLATRPSSLPRAIPVPRRSSPNNAHARAQYTPPQPLAAPLAAPAPSVPIRAESSVRLQYKGQSVVQVRGLATGLAYNFSGAQPLQEVDLRDAPSLLQTPFFRRA
jgi:hypothetical protein